MSDRNQVPEKPNRWVGPLIVFCIVAIVTIVLIASNPDSVPIAWAGIEWEAPLWLVLVIAFAAGAILVPLGRRLVRGYRRRSRRKAFEYEEAVRRAEEEGSG